MTKQTRRKAAHMIGLIPLQRLVYVKAGLLRHLRFLAMTIEID